MHCSRRDIVVPSVAPGSSSLGHPMVGLHRQEVSERAMTEKDSPRLTVVQVRAGWPGNQMCFSSSEPIWISTKLTLPNLSGSGTGPIAGRRSRQRATRPTRATQRCKPTGPSGPARRKRARHCPSQAIGRRQAMGGDVTWRASGQTAIKRMRVGSGPVNCPEVSLLARVPVVRQACPASLGNGSPVGHGADVL